MSGVVILARLAKEDMALTKLVPIARIMGDELPTNTPLPAISLLLVSSVDRNILAAQKHGTAHRTDRVQASVVAGTRGEARTIMAALRKALRNRIGPLAGRQNVTIHTDGQGPEFSRGDPSVFMATQDFRVAYLEDL